MLCLRDIPFRLRHAPAIHATFPRIIAKDAPLSDPSHMEHQNKQHNGLIERFRYGYLKSRARRYLHVLAPM